MEERDLHKFKTEILPLFENISIYRVDTAFDCNFNILNIHTKFNHTQTFSRVETQKNYTYKCYGSIEDSSTREIALYNKFKEDKNFCEWNYPGEKIVQRLEYRLKKKNCEKLLETNFNCLLDSSHIEVLNYERVRQKGKYKRYKPLDCFSKAMVENYIHDPITLKRFPADAQKEIKSLIERTEKIDLIPLFQSALDTKKAAIKDELESYLIS